MPGRRRGFHTALFRLSCVVMTLTLALAKGEGGGSSQPLNPSETNTIPAIPVEQDDHKKQRCLLDVSDELFGGVKEACLSHSRSRSRSLVMDVDLDRNRCCPVLAAWLYAAHARSALAVGNVTSSGNGDGTPMEPEDSQTCVNSLEKSLQKRGINIHGPNSTCDLVMCFCGIRLHSISSLTCPNAFTLSSSNNTRRDHNHTHGHNQTANVSRLVPLPAILSLEANCTSPSYAGCTTCLSSLSKLKGRRPGVKEGRSEDMYKRECEIMGLTWLLAKNKTAYIPTVSAVLRALLYSSSPDGDHHHNQNQLCSRDEDNMPLAVDSAQLDQQQSSAAVTSCRRPAFLLIATVFSLLSTFLSPN